MADYDDAFLDRMRKQGDPPADAVIRFFAGPGGPGGQGDAGGINAVLDGLKGTFRGGGSPIPAALKAYLEESSRLPSWADAAKIRRAQDLFTLHGPLFGVALLYKSLPVLYAGGKGGAQVLAMTGRLTHHYRQRASETLRFILDVMKPGGLGTPGEPPAPGAPPPPGIATAQRVRLMHAAVRHYASATPDFKVHPEWGVPINQEELGGTLLAFSSVALDGLAALGLTPPREDREAYLHAWKVVGHLLGIDPRLMTEDMGQARRAWRALVRRNFVRSPEGDLLMKDHLEFLDGLAPGKILDKGNPSLVRYLIGRRICKACFDLPPATGLELFLHAVRSILGLEKLGYLLFPGLARAARRVSVDLMEALQRYWSDGHSKPFRIPTGLPAGAGGD
jgi:hypothetical protein